MFLVRHATPGVPLLAAFAVLMLGSACSGPADDTVAQSTSSTAAVVTTTTTVPGSVEEPSTSRSATVSVEQLRIDAAAEIEAVVVAWYTFPTDTSAGESGMAYEHVTGPLEDRLRAAQAARVTAGEIHRARSAGRIEVRSVAVDLDEGRAELELCTLGDDELVDAETGELLLADDGGSWEGQAFAVLTEDGWKVSDFFSAQKSGGNTCELDA